MKDLYLLRHAKSSWDYPALSDRERPLNQRGKRDAPKMGKWLSSQPIAVPDLVLCSHSVRTLATISRLGHAWGLKGEDYITEPKLYHASPGILRQILHASPAEVNTLMLVGHNPGLSEFAHQLCPAHAVAHMPTCAVYGIRFHCLQWSEAGTENAEFLFFQFPKNIK